MKVALLLVHMSHALLYLLLRSSCACILCLSGLACYLSCCIHTHTCTNPVVAVVIHTHVVAVVVVDTHDILDVVVAVVVNVDVVVAVAVVAAVCCCCW